MNKQQLASRIWASANNMRSKIEANEYKDYILGFIFYKFLSDKEVAFLKKDGYTDEDLKEYLHEENEDLTAYCKENIGYFISYDNLFSTWLQNGEFSVADVREALSAFSRLIGRNYTKLFDKIFTTLETGLSKLGDNAGNQTKSINKLIQLIKDIPMTGRQDYDVLGFIYEYLISNFAANAGKKAGEFYTPHEVSVLMSEIVAHHLQGRQEIKIYDPTSGSGSLLITIGKSVEKYLGSRGSIKYYAQEVKENTHNLTRMNLIMRGISPSNIETRCGDTLEDDWPWFDESDPYNTYEPLYVDAVVSNPPYSQPWNPAGKDSEPRYKDFGLAPKGKADYAFLLHDLYHLKPDGIMTIVLPHGVLFRGDSLGGEDGQGENEGKIRRNLIENNHIEAIIGLPANIFFGTGIPTVIIVLRQKREESDVLFVDASKEFVKAGKNNKLQASHIKKIVDTVIHKRTTEKYSRLVSKQEIRDNGYNLNIPRYVDSSETPETWDIYATMFGGIPCAEIDLLNVFWQAFPSLRQELFTVGDIPYASLAVENLAECIENNAEVKAFVQAHNRAFSDFNTYLHDELIAKMFELVIPTKEEEISREILTRLGRTPLLDFYEAYQVLDDNWQEIATDLEIFQTEGFEAARKVEPNIVYKKVKSDGEELEVEVQQGWKGRIFPFELVQKELLTDDYHKFKALEAELAEISAEIEDVFSSFTEEEKDNSVFNEDKTGFVSNELEKKCSEIYRDISSPELAELNGYLDLLAAKAKKQKKSEYIAASQNVDWSAMEQAKDGTYAKAAVQKRIAALQAEYVFPEDSFEGKIMRAVKLMTKEKEQKDIVKKARKALEEKTILKIQHLTDEEVHGLLSVKWINPVYFALLAMPQRLLDTLVGKVRELSEKYAETYTEIGRQMKETEQELASMLDELNGSEFDMQGLAELKALLKGE